MSLSQARSGVRVMTHHWHSLLTCVAEKDQERATLNTFAARAAPEVAACEKYLDCTFEGIEKDQILARFFRLNPVDPGMECSLVIDVSSKLYKGAYATMVILPPFFTITLVMTSSPTLPSMSILVDTLNKTRDVFSFISDVRAAFKQLYPMNT